MAARNARSNKIDMTEGAILPKMLRFALPLMAASVLQLLFNAADIAVVGKFCGDVSLAAVSSNGATVNLLINLFVGISTGTNVLAARFFSAKSEEELRSTVHTSMLIALVSGAAATLIGVFGAPRMLVLMQVPDNVLPLASLYLRLYFLGMIPTIVYNFGAALLRAVGDTRRPLYYLMIAGVLNVVLNLIFVIFFHLDVAGVALATIISQTLSAVLVIICLMREEGGIRFEPRRMAEEFSRAKLMQIIRIGLPAGIQGTLFSISNIVIQSSINVFGDITMSGNGAAANIEGFGYMAMSAFYQSVISFTGQNYGRHKYKRILRVQLIGQACTIVTGLIFSVLVLGLGPELLWIYTDSDAVVTAGMIRFAYIAPFFFLGGTMDTLVGGLRGIGYSFVPMLGSLFGICVVRLVWIATVFQLPQFHTIETVYFSYPMTWAITTCIHLVSFILMMRKILKKARAEGFTE